MSEQPGPPTMVRFDTGDGKCVWINRDAIDAVGNKGEGSVVVLRSGIQLDVKGNSPDSIMFDMSDSWSPDAEVCDQ